MISTASKSLPLKDWLSDEHANMFFTIPAQPMPPSEEAHVLQQTGCPVAIIDTLLRFAEKYRAGMTADAVQKNRKLGTRALIRIARRVARFPADGDDLHAMLSRALLAEFLPATETMNLQNIFEECGINKRTPPVGLVSVEELDDMLTLIPVQFNPPAEVREEGLFFPPATGASTKDTRSTTIPRFDASQDREGAAHVPHMDHFYDNSLQTGLMRDLAIDFEILGEHLVLLGNQVSGFLP